MTKLKTKGTTDRGKRVFALHTAQGLRQTCVMWRRPVGRWRLSCGVFCHAASAASIVSCFIAERPSASPHMLCVVCVYDGFYEYIYASYGIYRQEEEAIAEAGTAAKAAALGWDLTAFRGKLLEILGQ